MALWNQPTTLDQNNMKPSGSDAPPVMPQTAPAAAAPTPTPSPVPPPRENVVTRSRRESVFGVGVSIEGKIEGDTDVRIAGKFKGDIQIKGELTVEKGAHVTAKINAANVALSGEVNGNVSATGQIRLLEAGQVIGDLKASTLTVAAGSRMRGHVECGWSAAESAKLANGSDRDKDK